jgi:hypothetical protein
MRRLLALIAALAGMAGSGCGATVSVSGGTITNDGPYRAAWEREWTAIHGDLAAYVATSDSPGPCNKGGTKIGCSEADRRLASDLRSLATQLGQVYIPGPYRDPTAQIQRAISAELHGLELRMSALGPGNYTMAQRNEWFQQVNAHLAEASALTQRGYAAFPEWARPTPAPRL